MRVLQTTIASSRHTFLLTLWCVLHALIFIHGYLKQKNDPTLDHLNRIGTSIYISRGAGLVLALDASLLLLPACRTLLVRSAPILSGKLGIPLGHPIAFHKVVAWTMLFFTVVHVTAHYVNFYTLEQLNVATAISLHYMSWAGITGHLMLFVMVLMYTTAQKPLRHAHYELFHNIHQLSFLFILLLLLHPFGCFVQTTDAQCKGYLSHRVILPGYLIYLAERVARIYRARRDAYIVDSIIHPGGVIELRLRAPTLKYTSGQYVYLNVPLVSRHQWHPFTITSAPHQEYVSFHIRRAGDWTTTVASLCGYNRFKPDTSVDLDSDTDVDKLPPAPPLQYPTVRLDGPFGTLTSDIFNYDVAVLVGGGIGVTPLASVLKDVLWRHQNNTTGRLRRVEFYWICRNMDSFEWFRADLARLEGVSYKGFLRVYIHLTGHQDPPPLQESGSLSLSPLATPQSHVSGTTSPVEADSISRTRRGRPDFRKAFDEIVWGVDGEGEALRSRGTVRVGVFVSGPRELRRRIGRDVVGKGGKGIEFSVYS